MDSITETKDAHGTILADGDQVFLIKDLTIKGSKNTIKQGTVYKIRLTDDPEEVDCPGGLVLKTCFVKKKK
ncbi:MAG: PhnA domain-containing protein [Candidatus Gracilibacteria bacterium]